jgi:Telomere resolvase
LAHAPASRTQGFLRKNRSRYLSSLQETKERSTLNTQPQLFPAPSVRHRIEVFLERIAPLYPELKAHGPVRHAALKRLSRICEREVNTLRSHHTLATVKLYLSSYRNALRAIDPNHPALSARKHRSSQRFSYLALTPEETRELNSAYQKEIHKEQSDLIALDAEKFILTATQLLDSPRFTSLGMALMALTGRRPAEIFFSAKFTLPKKKLSYPSVTFEGQLKTRNAPGTSFEPYQIPVLAPPKTLCDALKRLREIRTYSDQQRAHIGTKDALNNEVKVAFGQGDFRWKPGHLRSAYSAICCQKFKPQNMTDDIFISEILGHKLLPGAAALSVGQSYKDFYIGNP